MGDPIQSCPYLVEHDAHHQPQSKGGCNQRVYELERRSVVLVKKPVTALVKLNQRPGRFCRATCPNGMNHCRDWMIDHPPTLPPHSSAPVRVFPIEKKARVHQTYLVYSPSSCDHTGTGDPVHIHWRFPMASAREHVRAGNGIVREPFGQNGVTAE